MRRRKFSHHVKLLDRILGGRIRVEGTRFDERTQLAAVYAAAPSLPLQRDVTNVLPPFGTNPPNRPLVEYGTDLDQRALHNDPRELWYLSLPSKLTPNQVQMILRSAQGGDLWQQFQLYQLMLDTWPMLKKCDHEIREAVSSVRYIARPYAEEGEEPTEEAKAKADLVNRCFKSMKPNPFTDERGFRGMVYQLAGAYTMGLTMAELIWTKPVRSPKYGTERLLRAAAHVHPRHFTFTNEGTIAVFDNSYNRLYFALATGGQSPDPRKFVCGQYYSSSGSTLGTGAMRSLAWWWTSVVFNREWMARMAQNYGAPFLDVTYKPGTTPQELQKLDDNLKAGLANRFVRHIEGTVLNIHPGTSLGSENPQRYLAEMADKQCQLLLLGQTLTSDTPDNGGSRAQGEVHMAVRNDRIQGVARWVASDPLQQIARAILLVNYGEQGENEVPLIEPDFSTPLSVMEQAQYINLIGNSSLPILAEEAYSRVGLTMPEVGDKVVVRGQVGLLGDTKQELDPSPEPAIPEIEEELHQTLARMSASELDQIEQLVIKAEQAPHLNGEWSQLRERLMAFKS